MNEWEAHVAELVREKNTLGGEANHSSHKRMRSALEPVLSKALIWLGRWRCSSQSSRVAGGIGSSLPWTRNGGIRALQGLALCCHQQVARRSDCALCTATMPAADSCLPAPAGVWWRFRAGAVTSRLLVRESNPRQPDSQSGALPAELTTVGASTRPGHNPCVERAVQTGC